MKKICLIAVLCSVALGVLPIVGATQDHVHNPTVFDDVLTHISFKQTELNYTFHNLYLNINRIFTVTYKGGKATPEVQFVGKKASDLKTAVQYILDTSKENGDQLVSRHDLALSGNLKGAMLVFKAKAPKTFSKPSPRTEPKWLHFQKYVIVMNGEVYLSSFHWDRNAERTEFDQKVTQLLVSKQKESNK